MILSSFAFSAPVPLTPGNYHFEDFKVVIKKRFETVYAFNDQGRKRMQELFRQNYTCEHTGREIFLCSHFEPVENAKSEVSAKIKKELSPLKLEVEKAVGDLSLISEGDVIQEWEVPQKIKFNKKVYQNYRYLVTREMEKIFLGTPAVETFIFGQDKTIHYSFYFPVTESDTSYFMYLALGEFRL